jgi:hypothetical protein
VSLFEDFKEPLETFNRGAKGAQILCVIGSDGHQNQIRITLQCWR